MVEPGVVHLAGEPDPVENRQVCQHCGTTLLEYTGRGAFWFVRGALVRVWPDGSASTITALHASIDPACTSFNQGDGHRVFVSERPGQKARPRDLDRAAGLQTRPIAQDMQRFAEDFNTWAEANEPLCPIYCDSAIGKPCSCGGYPYRERVSR